MADRPQYHDLHGDLDLHRLPPASAPGPRSLLSRRQLVALWAGLLAFSLAALFPPWQKHEDFGRMATGVPIRSTEYAAGRHAWWSPPEVSSDFLNRQSAYVNYPQLLVELAVVALLTAGLVLTLHRRD